MACFASTSKHLCSSFCPALRRASTSALPRHVPVIGPLSVPRAAAFREQQPSTPYLRITGVASTTLPDDVRRFIDGTLGVSGENVAEVIRSLSVDYRPMSEYYVRFESVEAAEDAVANARAAIRTQALRIACGPLVNVSFADAETFATVKSDRLLLEPHYSGRAVRLSGIPRSAGLPQIYRDLHRQEYSPVKALMPIEWATFLKERAAGMHNHVAVKMGRLLDSTLVNALIPLAPPHRDFVAYLVRFTTAAEAHRLVRSWHLKRRQWITASGTELGPTLEPELDAKATPPYQIHASIVH